MYTSANWPYHCKWFNDCVIACKIKHFTEREFSGIFSLAGGNFAFSKREFPVALIVIYWIFTFIEAQTSFEWITVTLRYVLIMCTWHYLSSVNNQSSYVDLTIFEHVCGRIPTGQLCDCRSFYLPGSSAVQSAFFEELAYLLHVGQKNSTTLFLQ